ncbi:hypothetical protein GCM10007856_01170 [Azospirillum oryzae]|nr:hypothetical protein GCM10007856_01170 [Azospirillum oryzae]
MHQPIAEQHLWLCQVLRGHYGYYGYYGVPHNYPALSAFLQAVRRIWYHVLRHRSQKARCLTWDRFKALVLRYTLPTPTITRPWAERPA